MEKGGKNLIVKKFMRINCVVKNQDHYIGFAYSQRAHFLLQSVCLQCVSQAKHKTLSLTLLMQSNQLQTYCKVYCKVQLTEAINVLALR